MNTKSKIQERELDNIVGSRVILRWATGVGKSKAAIDLLKKYGGRTLLVVAERLHKENWEKELQRWKYDSDIDIICYHSLKKLEGEAYNNIVLDEAHHAFTEKRKDALSKILSTNVILLSATLSKEHIYSATELWGKFQISTVSLKEATESGALPEPEVNVIALELDDTDYKYSYKRFKTTVKCTQRGYYKYLTDQCSYWKEQYILKKNQFIMNKWMMSATKRKRFIGSLKDKYAKELLSKLPKNKRYICFCASIEQAKSIGGKQHCISSRKKQKENEAIIAAFNEHKIDSLFVVNMANEGMNLKDIEIGIIVQLDGKERLFIQKFGRSLRAENPVQYIFYFKNTQDERYLNNALENIDEKYVKRITLEDL